MSKNKKLGLLTYIKCYKWGVFAYILTNLIAGVCSVLTTIFFAEAVTQLTTSDFKQAMMTFLILLGLITLTCICFPLAQQIYNKYSTKIMSDLNQDLAKQAFKLNSRTYSEHETGTFVQRIVRDPEFVMQNLSEIVELLSASLMAIIIVIYISFLNFYVTLCLIAIIVIGLILEIIRIKVRAKNRREVRKSSDKIDSLTTEIVKSEIDIKSLSLDEKLSKISDENYKIYRNKNYKFMVTDTYFWGSRNFLIEVGMVLILMLGIILMDKAMLTLAAFMIIYSCRNSLYDVIWGIGNIANNFVEVKVCNERMFQLFDEDEFVVEKFGTETLPKTTGGCKIEFKNVSYSFKDYEYPKNKKGKRVKDAKKILKSENKIFSNLSFTIQPNTTVAFVGKSGSGKSTILNLISKMNEVDDGYVLINDMDIKLLCKDSLRQTISLVNQFPYIFDMSIKENLLLAKNDATDAEIEDAIARASLKDFVDTLPEKLNTKVGEGGIKLSGGQKQRLAIARAMLRNTPIIIFDESTSSLDNFAQGDIKKSIDNMKGKSTIVIVAHRLSTIKNVDKIFFLENGQITDEGTFEQLFENNKNFKEMFLAENI